MTVACEKSLSKRSAFANVALARHAFGGGVALRQRHHVRVVLDAVRPGATLGRGDDRAAVTRPEIDDVVLWRDFRHVEHLVHEGLRRRHPDDVLACLSDFRLEGGVAVCAKPLTVTSDKPRVNNNDRRSECAALMSDLPRTVKGMSRPGANAEL